MIALYQIILNMNIEYFLDKNNISKSELGRLLGYKTTAGIYGALNNERKRYDIWCKLVVMLLEKKGVNIERLLDSLN